MKVVAKLVCKLMGMFQLAEVDSEVGMGLGWVMEFSNPTSGKHGQAFILRLMGYTKAMRPIGCSVAKCSYVIFSVPYRMVLFLHLLVLPTKFFFSSSFYSTRQDNVRS